MELVSLLSDNAHRSLSACCFNTTGTVADFFCDNESMLHSYKDLIVWQRAIDLAAATYDLTSHFPQTEKFGLTVQMQRAAVSIASNIAEGRYRGTRKDFSHFLHIAYGSCAELETQLVIAKRIFGSLIGDTKKIESLMLETMKMLNSMRNKLKS